MNARQFKFLTGILMALASFLSGFAADSTLRETLEPVWFAHLKACKDGNEAGIVKNMAASRLAKIKNHLASAAETFSPAVFKQRLDGEPELDITKIKFVTLMEKGPTAGLLYVKDVEWLDANGKPYVWKDQNGRTHIQFIFIKFVKEGFAWKMDGKVEMSEPKVEGKEAVFNAEKWSEECRIDGVVPEVPELIPVAYSAGWLFVSDTTSCYQVETIINGFAQKTIQAGQAGAVPVYGGLRKGENKIILTLTKTKKEGNSKPEIKIKRTCNGIDCFTFSSTGEIEGRHEFTFTVKE